MHVPHAQLYVALNRPPTVPPPPARRRASREAPGRWTRLVHRVGWAGAEAVAAPVLAPGRAVPTAVSPSPVVALPADPPLPVIPAPRQAPAERAQQASR
jgi:hypothetical protein